jgi:hypothetical protein
MKLGGMVVEASYRYALLGVVGLVALVAIFAIVGPSLNPPDVPAENTVGRTSYYFPDPSEEYTVTIGTPRTVLYAGTTYQVDNIAVFSPDDTGKRSVILTVNTLWTNRLYPGNSQTLAQDDDAPMRPAIELLGIDGTTARFRMRFTSDPFTRSEASQGVIPDTLFLQEIKTYTLDREYQDQWH